MPVRHVDDLDEDSGAHFDGAQDAIIKHKNCSNWKTQPEVHVAHLQCREVVDGESPVLAACVPFWKIHAQSVYDIPSQRDIKECVISEEVVVNKAKPILLYDSKSETA